MKNIPKLLARKFNFSSYNKLSYIAIKTAISICFQTNERRECTALLVFFFTLFRSHTYIHGAINTFHLFAMISTGAGRPFRGPWRRRHVQARRPGRSLTTPLVIRRCYGDTHTHRAEQISSSSLLFSGKIYLGFYCLCLSPRQPYRCYLLSWKFSEFCQTCKTIEYSNNSSSLLKRTHKHL